MANSDQQVSGSTSVNPRPGNIAVKDQAKFHKNLPSKTVREIIDESIQDTTQPKPSDMGNHVNGMRRNI